MNFWQNLKQTVGDFFQAPLKLSRPIVFGGGIIYILDEPVCDALIAHNHPILAIIAAILAWIVGMITGWKESSYCSMWGIRRRVFKTIWMEEV